MVGKSARLWIVVDVLGLSFGLRCTAVRWFTTVKAVLVLLQLPFIPLPHYELPVMFIGVGLFGQQLSTCCRHFRMVIVTIKIPSEWFSTTRCCLCFAIR